MVAADHARKLGIQRDQVVQEWGWDEDTDDDIRADVEEACGAESRADFVHKMQIVLKELREACFWLRLLERSSLGPAQLVSGLREEASGLARMTAKSVVTAKSRR